MECSRAIRLKSADEHSSQRLGLAGFFQGLQNNSYNRGRIFWGGVRSPV